MTTAENGIVIKEGKRYATCQYDIISDEPEQWGWVRINYSGRILLDGNQAFAENKCFMLKEMEN